MVEPISRPAISGGTDPPRLFEFGWRTETSLLDGEAPQGSLAIERSASAGSLHPRDRRLPERWGKRLCARITHLGSGSYAQSRLILIGRPGNEVMRSSAPPPVLAAIRNVATQALTQRSPSRSDRRRNPRS